MPTVDPNESKLANAEPDVPASESIETAGAVFRQVGVGMAHADAHGRLTLANQALCSILARSMRDVLALSLQDLAREDAESGARFLARVCELERAGVDVLYLRPDATHGWIHIDATVRRNMAGTQIGFVVAVVDIAERKRLEAEQAQSNEELTRVLRGAEMFVGVLAHDLRNPLTAIITGLQVIHHLAQRSTNMTTTLARVLRSAERMRRMIDQLLDFTRLRSGKGIALERVAIDLEEVCRTAALEIVVSDDSTDIRFQVFGDARGHWDRDRLLQLASNLVGNALQYRLPGSPVVVTVDGRDAHEVVLDVWNQGTVASSVAPFQPLHGLEHRQEGKKRGLGLGLFISQQIAIAHAGNIRLHSSQASGTHVTVRLPRGSEANALGAFEVP
jgi:PAS domain S-box-containing protein